MRSREGPGRRSRKKWARKERTGKLDEKQRVNEMQKEVGKKRWTKKFGQGRSLKKEEA